MKIFWFLRFWIWRFSDFYLNFNLIITRASDVQIERKLNGLKAENVFFILVIKLASKNINISRYGKFVITSSFRRLYKISRFHFFIRQFDLYLIIDLIFCNKFQIKSNQINDLWKFIQIKSNRDLIWKSNLNELKHFTLSNMPLGNLWFWNIEIASY